MANYQDFAAIIEDENGILLTTMETLRDAHGVSKLGIHVRAAIADQLKSYGIGTLPEDLPAYQHEPVRLYRLGSPIANIISAVRYPSEAGDTTLRRAGGDAADKLRRVLEIVAE